MPADARKFDILNPEVKIPSVDTTYWCTIHRLPDEAVTRKNHIVQTEPIITPENKAIIHHMEVFHCEFSEGEETKVTFLGSGPVEDDDLWYHRTLRN